MNGRIDPRQVRRVGWRLCALTLSVYLLTAGGSLTTTDAVVTFDVTRSIVEDRSVALSGNLLGIDAEQGRNGRFYAPFGIGQSLYNVPFYLAAKAVTRLTGLHLGKPDSLAKAFVALGETLVVAAIVRECFLLAVAVLGDVSSAALAALTLGLASVLWPYSRFGFNQPLACFTLLAATRQTFLGTRDRVRWRLAAASAWLAASLMTRHEMAIASVPLLGWLWWDGHPSFSERAKRVAAFAPGLLIGIALWSTYNMIRFGSPLVSGQDTVPGFGSPVVPGLAGLLASPSTSVFLYSPVAAASLVGFPALARRDRSAALFAVSIIVAFLCFYASLGNWIGGRSYGSRYLIVVLPYFVLAWAAALSSLSASARTVAFAIVFAVGVVLQAPGVFVDYAKASQSAVAGRAAFTTEERQWRWDASPLALNTRALVRAVPENADYLLGRRAPPVVRGSTDASDRSFSQQFTFSLDLWWLYLYYLHVLPRWMVGVILAVACLVFGGVLRAIVALLNSPPKGGSASEGWSWM